MFYQEEKSEKGTKNSNCNCNLKITSLFYYFISSVRTASGLSVDRSASHSRRTPTRSEATSRSHHSTLAGEESGSIPEEVDHSVADSVASDLGLDLADDDSIADVLTGDDLKKPSGKYGKRQLYSHSSGGFNLLARKED